VTSTNIFGLEANQISCKHPRKAKDRLNLDFLPGHPVAAAKIELGKTPLAALCSARWGVSVKCPGFSS
jgi:hypothetical protein